MFIKEFKDPSKVTGKIQVQNDERSITSVDILVDEFGSRDKMDFSLSGGLSSINEIPGYLRHRLRRSVVSRDFRPDSPLHPPADPAVDPVRPRHRIRKSGIITRNDIGEFRSKQ